MIGRGLCPAAVAVVVLVLACAACPHAMMMGVIVHLIRDTKSLMQEHFHILILNFFYFLVV